MEKDDKLEVFRPEQGEGGGLPLAESNIQAGFPSPADDFIQNRLDLNEHLVLHPAATFFVRVAGDSMVGAGIADGDILVVDRSLEPADGRVVIAVVSGELVVKRLRRTEGGWLLAAENDGYPPIEIGEESDFEVWGVVTNVIHRL
jgi:DNA polymerase V